MDIAVLVIVAGLFIVVIVGLFLIYPILSFIHCLRNPDLSTEGKIAWACLIFFTWTLGAAIYGIVSSKRSFYRNTGIASLVIILLATIFQTPLKNWSEKRKTERLAERTQPAAPTPAP
jgi:hypothetical protein